MISAGSRLSKDRLCSGDAWQLVITDNQ
jgi:hypothetical protein